MVVIWTDASMAEPTSTFPLICLFRVVSVVVCWIVYWLVFNVVHAIDVLRVPQCRSWRR